MTKEKSLREFLEEVEKITSTWPQWMRVGLMDKDRQYNPHEPWEEE